MGFLAGYTADPPAESPGSYVGPGDIVSGATAWYGLRGYNAAYATGSNLAVNVRRASDNSTSDIVILANGGLDISTANGFAGVDATGSGTAAASTTIAITGASSTPHVGSTIIGAGVTQPCYIVSVATFTAGAGNITVNQAQTITAVSLTMQYALLVTEAYDQSGNGHHATQATAGSQPQLLPNSGQNGTPGLSFNGSQLLAASSFTTINNPISLAVVTQSGQNQAQFGVGSGTGLIQINTANLVLLNGGGTQFSATATNGSPHSIQGIINGASPSSIAVVDGSATTGTTGTGALNVPHLGSNFSGNNPMIGLGWEWGAWPVAFNSTQYGNQHTNASTFYGTP